MLAWAVLRVALVAVVRVSQRHGVWVPRSTAVEVVEVVLHQQINRAVLYQARVWLRPSRAGLPGLTLETLAMSCGPL